MGIFFWRNNRVIDEFADSIAQDFYNIINPQTFTRYLEAGEKSKDHKKLDRNARRAIQNTITRINRFRQQQSLGVYGKARLHMKFRNRLHELGYSDTVVEDVNKVIMLETP